MKHLKMLGLALVAIAVVAAIAGAGTASAEACTETPCAASNAFASGDTITGTLSSAAAVLAGPINESCTASTVAGSFTGATTGNITSATWTSCTPNCTNTAESLNWSTSFSPTAGTMNGTMTVSNPVVTVKCSIIKCTFTASSVVLDVTGGTPAVITANEEALTSPCGGATWTATYNISSATMTNGGTKSNPTIFLKG